MMRTAGRFGSALLLPPVAAPPNLCLSTSHLSQLLPPAACHHAVPAGHCARPGVPALLQHSARRCGISSLLLKTAWSCGVAFPTQLLPFP